MTLADLIEERRQLLTRIRKRLREAGYPADDYGDFHIIKAAFAFRTLLEQNPHLIKNQVAA